MGQKNIVQTAVAAGKFKTLVSLVKKAGLAGTLSAPGNLTVFAPTDQAFANILDNAFPLDAPYYAYVEVAQPSAWREPPVIDAIEILFVKTGTRLQ